MLMKNRKNKNLEKQSKQCDKEALSKRIISIFGQKNTWPLHSGKYHRLKCQDYFKSTAQVQIPQELQLYHNKQPSILKHIHLTNFPNLKHLDLKNNKIETVEHLSRLKAQNLLNLNLSDNHITRVTRSLSKSLKSLNFLKLYANNIVELDGNFCRTENSQAKQNKQNDRNSGMQIILGINYIIDFKWINKILHSEKMSFYLENNRCGNIVKHTQLKHWNIDLDKILI